MDQRTGIPISLSVVILLLAKRLSLSLVGVGLPGHFLVRYEEGSQKTDQQTYIDTFNRGQVLTKEECTKFIKDAGYGYREEFFRTSTSTEILVRMMRNLIFVYNQLQETQKVEWLSRYVMAVT
jgi:regulator of sirC expression with transglutaminase-like and TPR domain